MSCFVLEAKIVLQRFDLDCRCVLNCSVRFNNIVYLQSLLLIKYIGYNFIIEKQLIKFSLKITNFNIFINKQFKSLENSHKKVSLLAYKFSFYDIVGLKGLLKYTHEIKSLLLYLVDC